MSVDIITRPMIVAHALTWDKTPYHHQAALRGVGADCLGLLRGVYEHLYGKQPEKPPPYSASWAESGGRELLLNAAHKYLEPAEYDGWRDGDVLIFRVKSASAAKHCGIVVDDKHMIHAVSRRGTMVTGIAEWGNNVAGVFKFPGVV